MKLFFRKKKPIKSPSPNSKVMMENFFDDFCESQAKSVVVKDKFDTSNFAIDVSDDGQSYCIRAVLPGVQEKNIDVTYKDRHLTISVCKKSACTQRGLNFFRQERSWGRVSRSFMIDPIDESTINVTFMDDVLEIKMDKISGNEVM